MTKEGTWEPFSWFCPNCATKTTAYRNARGDVKAECSNKRCGVVMFRTQKGRRHITIDVYAPNVQAH